MMIERNPTALILASLGMMWASGAIAQDSTGGAASIETGASYSTVRGPMAFVGLSADDLMGSGVDLQLSYLKGPDGEALNAGASHTYQLGDTALGLDSYLRSSLTAQSSDWDSQDYSGAHYRFELTLGAESGGGWRYFGQAFWQSDTLDDFDDDISPLVATPLDRSTAAGIGLGLSYSTFSGLGPLATGMKFEAGVRRATPLGDREWDAVEMRGRYNVQVSENVVMALAAEAGQISGRGDEVGIIDRAYIGNPMPRGFAYAGIGPRDVFGDDIDTALGGNRYLTSSAEVRFATPNPAMSLGVFVDGGAVWELDQTEGGASGVIDDSYALRTAAGVSLYWDTQIGLLQINAAEPISKVAGDKVENFSINLNFRF